MNIEELKNAKHELRELSRGIFECGRYGERYWHNWLKHNRWFFKTIETLIDDAIRQTEEDETKEEKVLRIKKKLSNLPNYKIDFINKNFNQSKYAVPIEYDVPALEREIKQALFEMRESLEEQFLENNGEQTSYDSFSTETIKTAIALMETESKPTEEKIANLIAINYPITMENALKILDMINNGFFL